MQLCTQSYKLFLAQQSPEPHDISGRCGFAFPHLSVHAATILLHFAILLTSPRLHSSDNPSTIAPASNYPLPRTLFPAISSPPIPHHPTIPTPTPTLSPPPCTRPSGLYYPPQQPRQQHAQDRQRQLAPGDLPTAQPQFSLATPVSPTLFVPNVLTKHQPPTFPSSHLGSAYRSEIGEILGGLVFIQCIYGQTLSLPHWWCHLCL